MARPLICVTLNGCTVDEMLKDAARATAAGADLAGLLKDFLYLSLVPLGHSDTSQAAPCIGRRPGGLSLGVENLPPSLVES